MVTAGDSNDVDLAVGVATTNGVGDGAALTTGNGDGVGAATRGGGAGVALGTAVPTNLAGDEAGVALI